MAQTDDCDWRLPDIKELASILDLGRLPAIHPLFSQPTCTGCADVTQASCSCNVDWYMSSTTYVNDDYEIYAAHFDYGSFGRASKRSRLGARAVRNQ